MAAKNVAQYIDTMKVVVGVVQEELHLEVENLKELQNMNKRLDLLFKFQEDSAHIASLSSDKAKEVVVLGPLVGDTQGTNGSMGLC